MFRIVAKYTWLLILFWGTLTDVYGHTVNERNRMAVSIGLDSNNAYYTTLAIIIWYVLYLV